MTTKNPLPHVLIVAGPTASGKSDFAVTLAEKVGGEVVSADSCQIYKKLNLGTGKITKEEMNDVPHHMLDILDINESFSVEEYTREALPLINDIVARGKVPIICGGTGQYIDALLFTNTPPKVPPNHQLREILEKNSTPELFTLLEQKDSRRAKSIDRHNRVRLIRALEIIEALGKVPELEDLQPRFVSTMYLLNPPKETLEERVHARLLKRLEQGMIEEVDSLLKEGYKPSILAKRGIEYKYIVAYIENKLTKEELVEHLRIATWQYAKRQRTWNKKYKAEKLPGMTLVEVE